MKIFIFFVSVVSLLVSCNTSSPTHDILVTNVSIIDVLSGEILENKTIGIDGDRISKIYEQNIEALTSSIIVDGKNRFIIPGLWDMHIHYCWSSEDTAPYLIANGIVGVREMFGNMNSIKKLRSSMAGGSFVGPEIFSSGAIIDGPKPIWPGSDKVANAEDAEKIVVSQLEQGVDFLKVYSLLSKESYSRIAELAKQNNITFSGHVPQSVTIWQAIASNQKSIEHNTGVLEATSFKADSLHEYYQNTLERNAAWKVENLGLLVDSHSEKQMDSLISVLSSSNTWLCPTMVVLRGIAYSTDSTFIRDKRQEYVPGYILDMWGYSMDTAVTVAFRRNYELQKKQLKKMINGGVKIVAGTDYPNRYTYPGFSLHDELEIFVEAGFTNLQALQTATLNPAIFLEKIHDHGTIDESKYADLVLLNSNPLTEINNIRDINSVFVKGEYFSREDIDKILGAR